MFFKPFMRNKHVPFIQKFSFTAWNIWRYKAKSCQFSQMSKLLLGLRALAKMPLWWRFVFFPQISWHFYATSIFFTGVTTEQHESSAVRRARFEVRGFWARCSRISGQGKCGEQQSQHMQHCTCRYQKTTPDILIFQRQSKTWDMIIKIIRAILNGQGLNRNWFV